MLTFAHLESCVLIGFKLILMEESNSSVSAPCSHLPVWGCRATSGKPKTCWEQLFRLSVFSLEQIHLSVPKQHFHESCLLRRINVILPLYTFFKPLLNKYTQGQEIRQITHRRDKQFLDLLHGSLEFDLSAVLRVFHSDEDMQVFVQVFPVGLSSVLLFLFKSKEKNCLRTRAVYSIQNWIKNSKSIPEFEWMCHKQGAELQFEFEWK